VYLRHATQPSHQRHPTRIQTQNHGIPASSCVPVPVKTSPLEHRKADPHLQNTILSSLLESAPPTPQYKYAVNSTIIQHLDSRSTSDTSSSTTQAGGTLSLDPLPAIASSIGGNEASGRDTHAPVLDTSADETRHGGASASSTKPEKGRRGMHSATGAYWNNETDGMWSWKYEGGEAKGMDVVVSIIWIVAA